jgi:hypothetical protein
MGCCNVKSTRHEKIQQLDENSIGSGVSYSTSFFGGVLTKAVSAKGS